MLKLKMRTPKMFKLPRFQTTSFLYTNVPIIDTFNVIKDYASNDDQFTRKMAIPQDKFLELVNLVLKTTWYTYNSQFYQQTDGRTSIFNHNRKLYAGSRTNCNVNGTIPSKSLGAFCG